MSLEVYVPPDGLQGQRIPGHVLWSGIEVDSISVECGGDLTLLETFNASAEYTRQDDRSLEVHQTLTPGYLGFVFQSHRSETLDSESEVRISIVPKQGEPIASSHTVRLFRATVSVASAPAAVELSSDGTPSALVELRHEGHGTLIVTIDTAEESDVRLEVPEKLTDAYQAFKVDLEKGVSALRMRYPQYKKVFEPIDEVVPKGNEAVVEALRSAYEEVEGDENFAADVSLLLTETLLRNTDFELMVVNPILDFLKSVVSGGVILAAPWREFSIPEGDSNLHLTLKAQDVTRVEVVNMTLPPIKVRSPRSQRVSLDRVISWGERARLYHRPRWRSTRPVRDRDGPQARTTP